MAVGCRPTRKRSRAAKLSWRRSSRARIRGWSKVKIVVTADESSGDLSYGTGTYEITDADGSHIDHGKWMNVSKKSNGTWKIQCDIFNSDTLMPTVGAK